MSAAEAAAVAPIGALGVVALPLRVLQRKQVETAAMAHRVQSRGSQPTTQAEAAVEVPTMVRKCRELGVLAVERMVEQGTAPRRRHLVRTGLEAEEAAALTGILLLHEISPVVMAATGLLLSDTRSTATCSHRR